MRLKKDCQLGSPMPRIDPPRWRISVSVPKRDPTAEPKHPSHSNVVLSRSVKSFAPRGRLYPRLTKNGQLGSPMPRIDPPRWRISVSVPKRDPTAEPKHPSHSNVVLSRSVKSFAPRGRLYPRLTKNGQQGRPMPRIDPPRWRI